MGCDKNIIFDIFHDSIIENVVKNKWKLIHLGQMTHICVSKLAIIGSDNVLSPGRHQAIIWTNAGIYLIMP